MSRIFLTIFPATVYNKENLFMLLANCIVKTVTYNNTTYNVTSVEEFHGDDSLYNDKAIKDMNTILLKTIWYDNDRFPDLYACMKSNPDHDIIVYVNDLKKENLMSVIDKLDKNNTYFVHYDTFIYCLATVYDSDESLQDIKKSLTTIFSNFDKRQVNFVDFENSKKDSNILRGNISSDLILQELNPSEEVLKKAQDLYEWFTDQHFLE